MRLRKWDPVLLIVLPVLLWSAWKPFDWITWWLEVAPVFIGFAALFIARRKGWVFSNFAQACIVFHMIVLIVGGHYTYARVPMGDWAKEAFDFSRNHYDRLGHFAQGFVPAILAREILLRRSPLRPGRWLFFLVACVCLAVSATYELIEWWTALATGEGATAFLGTQGDPWDTQWDMFLALIGALSALILLARAHDRQLAALAKP